MLLLISLVFLSYIETPLIMAPSISAPTEQLPTSPHGYHFFEIEAFPVVVCFLLKCRAGLVILQLNSLRKTHPRIHRFCGYLHSLVSCLLMVGVAIMQVLCACMKESSMDMELVSAMYQISLMWSHSTAFHAGAV
jgi:hypothetical protein